MGQRSNTVSEVSAQQPEHQSSTEIAMVQSQDPNQNQLNVGLSQSYYQPSQTQPELTQTDQVEQEMMPSDTKQQLEQVRVQALQQKPLITAGENQNEVAPVQVLQPQVQDQDQAENAIRGQAREREEENKWTTPPPTQRPAQGAQESGSLSSGTIANQLADEFND